MKRTIMLEEQHTQRHAYEVDFPVYRRHVLDHSTIYTRINHDLSAISIDVDDSGHRFEVEYEAAYRFDGSPPDYHLGRGMYACTHEQFERAVQQLHAFLLTRIPV